MKKYIFSMLLAVLTLGMQAQTITHYLCVADSSGNVTKWKATVVDSIYFESYTTYDFVDLGLESGTLWATQNLGASAPEEAGDFFAWGETATKTSFNWAAANDYLYGMFDQDDANYGMTKYNTTDELLVLNTEDDAARSLWKSTWRLPSKDQWQELLTSCTWVWKTLNGVVGYEVVGSNGNSIFLPAAGKKIGNAASDVTTNGGYWSATLFNSTMVNRAWYLNFSASAQTMSGYSRYVGFSVRPISIVAPATPDNPLGEEEKPSVPIHNGHEYVDLGLPSGLLWATCNVGADSPEAYGDYYACGETISKNDYSSSTLKYNGSASIIPLANDAAHVNWGGEWRMPKMAELLELVNNCTWLWTTQNGVNGYKVTGPNGNEMFFPAAGSREGTSLNDAGSNGVYWSSSCTYSSSAYYLRFNSSYHDTNYHNRYLGHTVRPVVLLP